MQWLLLLMLFSGDVKRFILPSGHFIPRAGCFSVCSPLCFSLKENRGRGFGVRQLWFSPDAALTPWMPRAQALREPLFSP